jgi:hypothetical protein
MTWQTICARHRSECVPASEIGSVLCFKKLLPLSDQRFQVDFERLSVEEDNRAGVPIGSGVLIPSQVFDKNTGGILGRPGIAEDFCVTTVVPASRGLRLSVFDLERRLTGFCFIGALFAILVFGRRLRYSDPPSDPSAEARRPVHERRHPACPVPATVTPP